ncbi:hypothetical protein CRENBAI_020481 [Crenichthys baileyi]|uniref:Uncharacterized protein n=1 Tax=Crenichthys baileyi TaxID=28760 RepID=A0AAV9S6C4_9TELE
MLHYSLNGFSSRAPMWTCRGFSALHIDFKGKNELPAPVICPSSLVTVLSSLRSEQLLPMSFLSLLCGSENSEERLDQITRKKEGNCLLTCYTLDCYCRCLRVVTAVNLLCVVTHVERESLRNGLRKCLLASQRSQTDIFKDRKMASQNKRLDIC